MRMIASVLALCLLSACGGAAATGQGPVMAGSASSGPVNPGDRVVAHFRGGGFWFAGRVDTVQGGMVTVTYLDGDHETLPESQVRPFSWGPGTQVDCNWKRGGKFYPGQITSLQGDTAHISYNDGDQEDTSVAFCRTR